MGTRNILLVEDDRALAVGIRLALADNGWEVRTAASLGEAMEALRVLPAPDVVITELALFDGPPATRILEELAREPALAGVPVVVISGWQRAREVAAAHGVPAENVLAKPLDLRELEAAVARCAARAPDRRPAHQMAVAEDAPHRTGAGY
jgi:two-component system KDP operon response regulator KdpE